MKAAFTIITFSIIICNIITGQSYSTKEMLKAIEGQYEVDDNGNISYTKIIDVDSITKDVIYQRASDWFTYNYANGENVVQVDDKENGHIVGKGVYANVHSQVGLTTFDYDTWHIVRIDTKDFKVRIILSLTDYRLAGTFSGTTVYSTHRVSAEYPINKEGDSKNAYGKAFAKSHERAMATLASFEKAIKEGTTFKKAEGKDW